MSKPCDQCGGSGQRSYFKGESRFLLSWDECPACCGTGVTLEATESDQNGIEQTTGQEQRDDQWRMTE